MRTLSGIVTSNKMAKTLVVEVTRQVKHPLYKKIIKKSKKFKVHSEDNQIQIGDRVKFSETRPISGAKNFKLVAKL